MKKRLLALLVACAMIVSLLPVQVLAYDGADASVQTQAEEVEPEAGEPQAEGSEEASEAGKSDGEASKEDKSEADKDKSEAEEDKSEADEDNSEAEADKSEAEGDKSKPEVPDASEPEVPEEAEPQAEEGEESVNPQEAEAEPEGEEGLTPQSVLTLASRVRIEAPDCVTRFMADRCGPDGGYQRIDCWPDNFKVVLLDAEGNDTNTEFKLDKYYWDEEEKGEPEPENYNPMDEMAEDISEALNQEVKLCWESSESNENPWNALGLYDVFGPDDFDPGTCDCAYISLWTEDEHGNRTDCVYAPYAVQIVELEGLAVDDIERSVYNRREHDYKDNHYDNVIDCWPDEFTVTIRFGENAGDTGEYPYDSEKEDSWGSFQRAVWQDFPGLRLDFGWRSTETDAAQWQAGVQYSAQFFHWSYVDDEDKYAEYGVNVVGSPFAFDEYGNAAHVDDFAIFETDLNFMDEDDDDPSNDWYRLNCDPRMEESVEVYLRNEEDPEHPIVVNGRDEEDEDSDWNGNRWSVEEQLNDEDGYNLDMDLWWETDERPGDHWDHNTNGGTITARLIAHMWKGDYDIPLCEYTVTVLPAIIQSADDISVGDMYRLNDDRFWQGDYDDVRKCPFQWLRLNCHPDDVSVQTTLQNEPFVGDKDDVCDEIREWIEKNTPEDSPYRNVVVDSYWESDERPVYNEEEDTYSSNWAPGDNYTATLNLCGWQKDYTIHLLAPEDVFQSVTVDPFNLFENDRCEEEEVWISGEEVKNKKWQRLDCNPNNQHVVVTVIDPDNEAGVTVFDSNAPEDDGDPDSEPRFDNLRDMVDCIQDHLRERFPGIRLEWDDEWDSDEVPVLDGDEYHGSYVAGDTPYTARLFLGGKAWEYQVTVLEKPVLNILSVERYATGKDIICRFVDDRCEDGRVDCWPTNIEASFGTLEPKVYKDLDELAEAMSDELGAPVDLGWDSDEEEDDRWTVENNYVLNEHDGEKYPGHFATITLMGERLGDPYSTWNGYVVMLVDPEDVFAVEVPDAKVLDTFRRREWDEENDLDWLKLDCYPGNIEVTAEGQKFESDAWDEEHDRPIYEDLDDMADAIASHLREKGYTGIRAWVKCRSSEDPSDDRYQEDGPNAGWTLGEWTVGEYQPDGEEHAWVDVCGTFTPYKVTVLENPIESGEFEDDEYVRSTKRNHDEETDEEYELNCPPSDNNLITLYLKDGLNNNQPVTGYFRTGDDDDIQWKLEQALEGTDYADVNFETHWYTDDFEDYENRWDHGTYMAWITIGGEADRAIPYLVHVTNENHKNEHMSLVPAVKATCTAAGNIAYYLCEACHKYFEDAAGKLEIFDIEDPAKGHTLTHTAAKAAQVGVAGNIEYWRCSDCGKYFRDEAGTQEITQAQTVVAALPQPQPQPQPEPQPQPQPPAPTALTAANVSVAAEAYVYDGTAKTPAVTVTSGGKTLTEGRDYTLSYANNVNAGTATVTVTGIGAYTGTAVKSFAIAKAKAEIIAQDLVKPAGKTVKYKLSVKAPGALTFKSKNKKVLTVDAKGNVKLAKAKTMCTAKVAITSAETENYQAATKTITVMIGPAGVKLNSAKAGKAKKTIDVSWAKGKKGVTGYQVQYCLDKKFTTGAKTAKVKGAKTAKTTLKKLKSGKKYFIRVRAVQGKFYSPWSSVKNAEVK